MKVAYIEFCLNYEKPLCTCLLSVYSLPHHHRGIILSLRRSTHPHCHVAHIVSRCVSCLFISLPTPTSGSSFMNMFNNEKHLGGEHTSCEKFIYLQSFYLVGDGLLISHTPPRAPTEGCWSPLVSPGKHSSRWQALSLFILLSPSVFASLFIVSLPVTPAANVGPPFKIEHRLRFRWTQRQRHQRQWFSDSQRSSSETSREAAKNRAQHIIQIDMFERTLARVVHPAILVM